MELWDQLWGIYGALGYGGANGERAQEALAILKKCLSELSRREKLQSQVYEEIQNITESIKNIDGVLAIVLFGSYSRGDFDEGSDIDLLVIFRSKEELKNGMKRIYSISARSDYFFQIICLTIDEIKYSPLLESILREGKIYHGKNILGTLLKSFKPYALITYSTVNLSLKERALIAQKLEGRVYRKYKYDGLIQQLGGYKVEEV
ncbi:MAG: nucleotidyltransferase domain-containing protein [Nitrososphaerota archaeon]